MVTGFGSDMHRIVWTGLLCLLTTAEAQPVLVDTLAASQSEARAVLAPMEPARQPRRLDGVQRLIALWYPTATGGVDHFKGSLPELVAFIDSNVGLTDTRFTHEEHSLDSFAFDEALLLMLTGNRAILKMSDGQKKLLGDYLRTGGLLFAEDVRDMSLRGVTVDVGQAGTPFDRLLKTLIADPLVLGGHGNAWRPVRKDHPMFHSFFQFNDGPPQSGTAGRRGSVPRVTELEMLEYRGRVAVVFSDLNISFAWGMPEAIGRERALQFGANLVVFALAQQAAGGDARR